ncbi:MAG: hypothetical protein ACRD3W_31630 [Terriglobales bacterium]
MRHSTVLHPSRLPWCWLADFLEIQRPADALPMRVQCPICSRREMYVYQDTIGSGEWAHCFNVDCRFSGDMIELAAATWKASPHAAVRRLVALGLALEHDEVTPESLQDYVARFPGSRMKARDFWHRCRKILVNSRSEELGVLRAKYRLLQYCAPDDWDRGLGSMVGAACAKEIEFLFRPYNRQPDSHVTQSPRKVFRGTCWRDVLVTTSFAAPGLLCGFHFLGRSGERGHDN